MSPPSQSAAVLLVEFLIEEQHYALPVPVVDRVLPMVAVAALPQAPAIALGVINVHGRVVPVVDIRRRFGLPPLSCGLRTKLLLGRTSRRTLALPVDEVLGVREVTTEVVTPPATILPGIGHMAGIAALPDGLLFIHDLDAFLSLDEEQQLIEALSPPPFPPPSEGEGQGGGARKEQK
jgi:purine-binding chemotaxis protein CheW